MNKYLVRANELMDEMVADRRHFHRFPELTNELPETTKFKIICIFSGNKFF